MDQDVMGSTWVERGVGLWLVMLVEVDLDIHR